MGTLSLFQVLFDFIFGDPKDLRDDEHLNLKRRNKNTGEFAVNSRSFFLGLKFGFWSLDFGFMNP